MINNIQAPCRFRQLGTDNPSARRVGTVWEEKGVDTYLKVGTSSIAGENYRGDLDIFGSTWDDIMKYEHHI